MLWPLPRTFSSFPAFSFWLPAGTHLFVLVFVFAFGSNWSCWVPICWDGASGAFFWRLPTDWDLTSARHLVGLLQKSVLFLPRIESLPIQQHSHFPGRDVSIHLGSRPCGSLHQCVVQSAWAVPPSRPVASCIRVSFRLHGPGTVPAAVCVYMSVVLTAWADSAFSFPTHS